MPLKLYQYDKCATCRKARQWLDAHRIAYTPVPIRETPPSTAELKTMLEAQGGNLRKLFNTSGMDYKELGMKDRLPHLEQKEALELLGTHGNLVKRPFLIGENVALAGFHEDTWEKAFA